MYIKSTDIAYLHKEIQREPREKDVREELDNVERSEDNPIDQPLSIVVFSGTFHGFYTENTSKGLHSISNLPDQMLSRLWLSAAAKSTKKDKH